MTLTNGVFDIRFLFQATTRYYSIQLDQPSTEKVSNATSSHVETHLPNSELNASYHVTLVHIDDGITAEQLATWEPMLQATKSCSA